jgi:hypothetical protein
MDQDDPAAAIDGIAGSARASDIGCRRKLSRRIATRQA